MMTSDQPLVSVLTPVYNGEKYLAECIDSVLAQTYRNWEYIIVNNCSTDRSLEIAHSYAKRDARIRIHENGEFVSAIENHNCAFRLMSRQSRYCKVVHADDWLFPECLTQMVAVAEAHPEVGVVGSYRLDGTRVNLDGLPYPSTVVPGRELCRASLFGDLYVFGSPTSSLLRSSEVRARGDFYDGGTFSLSADVAACYDVLQNADFGFVHQVLTYSRRHEESETSAGQGLNKWMVANLLILKKYGPAYLTREEYEKLFNVRMKRYYKFLSRHLLGAHDPRFWDYHKDCLIRLGTPLSKVKIFNALCLGMLDIGLAPLRALKRIFGLNAGFTAGVFK